MSLSASAGGERGAAARVRYSLDWWVGRDGTATKRYEMSYEGDDVLRRLDALAKGFGSRLAYVENFVPFLEATDRLAERKEVSRGRYVFLYRSSKKHDVSPDAKPSLIVWAPVMDDPLAVVWESVEGSRYRYRFRDIEVSTRVTVRGPWRFPAGLSHGDRTFGAPGIDARLVARELRTPDRERKDPGHDLDGMEIRSVVRTEPYELRDEDFVKLRERLEEWSRSRLSGAALVGYPGETGAAQARFGGGSEFGVKSIDKGGNSFAGFDLSLQTYYRRSYSRYFAWRLASLRLDVVFGTEPEGVRRSEEDRFFSFRAGLSSLAELRLPMFLGNDGGSKTYSYLEIYGGPGVFFTTLSQDTVEEVATDFAPGATAGLRWGISDPNMAFLGSGALGFRYSTYFGKGRTIGSSFMFTMETLL